jgi:hypothetical protein
LLNDRKACEMMVSFVSASQQSDAQVLISNADDYLWVPALFSVQTAAEPEVAFGVV